MSFQSCAIVKVGAIAADYRKQEHERGEIGHVVSSSTLRTFADCPSRWLNGYDRPETAATRWGTLLDRRFLTPKDFQANFVERPETYTNKEGKTLTWRNDERIAAVAAFNRANADKEIISRQESLDVDCAATELHNDETIRAWEESCDVQVWVRGEWRDEETGLVIPVQCLIDYVPRKDSEFCKCLGDLKSTRNAAPRPWARWCWQAGYHIQAAWNLDMYCAATGEDRNTFCFILSENFPPWQPAKRMLSQQFTTLGRNQYQAMLTRYCRCLKSGDWPDYDSGEDAVQGWTVVEAENWMQEQIMLSMPAKHEPQPEHEEDMNEVPIP